MSRDQDWLDKLLAAVATRLDRHSVGWVAVLFAAMMLVGIGAASHTCFVFDEQVTYRTASLPSFGAIWRFYADGFDTTGPMQSLVGRLGLYLPLAPEIALRLPFMVAFLCMCAGLYRFVRHRYAAGYALAAMLLPVAFPGLFTYMNTARAYALVLGAAALALCLWQAAAEGAGRPWSAFGLWLTLAFAMAAHFFSVFLFIPFAAAQLVQDWQKRRPDWPVWTALLLFPAGFLPFLRGAQNARANYAATFFAKPDLLSVEDPFEVVYKFNCHHRSASARRLAAVSREQTARPRAGVGWKGVLRIHTGRVGPCRSSDRTPHLYGFGGLRIGCLQVDLR